MEHRPTLLARIYRLKLIVAGSLLVVAGLLASAGGDWLGTAHAPHLLVALVNSLSDVFLVTGAIGIAVDFFTGRDKEAADIERLHNVITAEIPTIRDAVIAGFAESPNDMRSVATTETLDKLATNALAMRLGDEKFAAEIYAGLLARAVRSAERWYDVDVSVRLSGIPERSPVRAPRPTPMLGSLFDVVVTWEYTLRPSGRIKRFVATNDLEEFGDLLDDAPDTSAWYIATGTADASDVSAFEVLSYTVNGEAQRIRRAARKGGQTYTVDLGTEVLASGKPVRIRQVYRTVVRQSGHRFRIALIEPTENLNVSLDYSDTTIAELKVGDMVSSGQDAVVSFLPTKAPAKQVNVTVPGWLLPPSEVSFVWTLDEELALHDKRAS